jgi:FkbM family methyltransferase
VTAPHWDFLRQLQPYVPLYQPVQMLDAGANVGYASILMASFIGYRGHITAVEANPPTFKVLRNNLAYNEVRSKASEQLA